MNDIEDKYKFLIDKAIGYMEQCDDPVHGIGHILGVVENVKLLLKKCPDANKEVCILSAYWHDVGRIKGKEGHEVRSAEMLKKELISLNLDDAFIDGCYKAIYKHQGDCCETIEGIIIRDADKLDDLGLKRWQECIEKNARLPRIIVGLRDKLLLDYSKLIYDDMVILWLNFLKEITLGEK